MIKIGVVYEGGADTEIVQKIIEKILTEFIGEFEITKLIKADSGIIGFLKSYVTQLFDVLNVDIAVYFTDQDVPSEKDNRMRHIREEIERLKPGCGDFSAIALSDPHLEQWLLADEDLLKSIFGCDGDKALPYPEQQPKFRLKSLWAEAPVPKTSMRETMISIVENSDLAKMKRIPNFRTFADELITRFKQVQLQKQELKSTEEGEEL